MNTFTLKTGSEFEMVDATYRISRVLGHSEVVCENVETGDVIKMSVLQVSQAVESSALVVNDRMKGEAATCITSMQQLSSEKVLCRTNRKIGYVRHIRHYEPHAVSGLKIERLVSEAAKALGDIAPPSARNVTRWLKKYDQDQSLAIPTRRRAAGKNNLSRALAVESLLTHYLSTDQETLADCRCYPYRSNCFRKRSPCELKIQGGLYSSTGIRLRTSISSRSDFEGGQSFIDLVRKANRTSSAKNYARIKTTNFESFL